MVALLYCALEASVLANLYAKSTPFPLPRASVVGSRDTESIGLVRKKSKDASRTGRFKSKDDAQQGQLNHGVAIERNLTHLFISVHHVLSVTVAT